MSEEIPTVEVTGTSGGFERARFGLIVCLVALIIMVVGAKPEWLGLDRNPGQVGFAQISLFLIGLAILCFGGYIGLSALWNGEEKSILADIGSRLVSTGYVIALFSGFSDTFGMNIQSSVKKPFFGPWQEAGMQIGMLIILAGVLMIIPYKRLARKK